MRVCTNIVCFEMHFAPAFTEMPLLLLLLLLFNTAARKTR